MKTLNLTEIFGVSPPAEAPSATAVRSVAECDLGYTPLTPEQCLNVESTERLRIDGLSPTRRADATERSTQWDSFWRETSRIYHAARTAAYTPATATPPAPLLMELVPRFLHTAPLPARFNGGYVQPRDPAFVYYMQRAILTHMVERYLPRAQSGVLMELGCGSGFNLEHLRTALGLNTVYGVDYSETAVELVASLGINAFRADLEHPYTIPEAVVKGAVVLTSGCLEQLGPDRWKPLLNWLLKAKPAVCIHIEPLLELYDMQLPNDAVAAAYHRARGYFEGFVPALYNYLAGGRVDILEMRRVRFGALHNDGFSWVVWSPI